ncbi:peroxisomal d3,d2-enoyl-CoA isomerase-like protein [Hyaloraphidium curvatum]|nr:peroxisomal d3,d2-enoyl-CoA isomerase-like protein [Hyaloraphidium curvatum]
MPVNYKEITFTLSGAVAEIKINRAKTLNSLTADVYSEIAHAMLTAAENPAVVFTVLTGEGRFFSSGADVGGNAREAPGDVTDRASLRLLHASRFTGILEAQRAMIDHPKIFIIALNGPAIGVAAAWLGYADILLAAKNAYLQVPFSSLGLVPEAGAGITFQQSLGVRVTNEILVLGRKMTADDLHALGFVNRVFPDATFRQDVRAYLDEQLEQNEFSSMLEAKRLINAPLREERILANYRATDALANRFVENIPAKRFLKKAEELAAKRAARNKAKI